MIKFFLILYLITTIKYASSVIVPQELPSILSLVYSNIPQLRKGHDSRYGFGFRLGDNADIQFVVELGPQSETRPLGQDGITSRKRAVSQSQYTDDNATDSVTLKKHQKDKKVAEAANWLKNWSKDQYRKKKLESKELASSRNNRNKPPIVNGMLNLDSNTITMVPEDALDQLTALYKTKSNSNQNDSILNQ